MTSLGKLPSDLVGWPIQGRGLDAHVTLGSLLDDQPGTTVLVFLRHYG